MNRAFNLVDEPWIPVRHADGSVNEVGLADALTNAHRYTALAEASPVNLIGLYRLLIAVLLDAQATGPHPLSLEQQWREGFAQDWIRRYLGSQRDRFWVFHPTHPFLQVPALRDAKETAGEAKRKPWTQLALERASGNTPTLFDHSVDETPSAIPAAIAVRCMLGILQATPGGLVKVFKVSDKAGPVADAAVVVPLGSTLAHTLLLCMPPTHDPRFPHDHVAWTREPPSADVLRRDAPTVAAGPRDRFTRLTRALLLEREPDATGTDIRWIRFGEGLALMDDPSNPDPMVAYRMGTDKLMRVGFSEGRAFWRDMAALLPDPNGRHARPPDVINNALATLDRVGADPDSPIPVLVAGLASNQAKLERWRCESVLLPRELATDASLAEHLRTAISNAEATAHQLRGIAGKLAAAILPGPDTRNKRKDAYAICDRYPMESTFFTTLERRVPSLLGDLAGADVDGAFAHWNAARAKATRNAWDATVRAIGRSTSALRAVALSEPSLRAILRNLEPQSVSQYPNPPIRNRR